MTVYVDSSFLLSLYLNDRHSVEARSRVASASDFWFSPLHRAESLHAIAQHVFRGIISPAESDAVYDQLAKDRVDGVWRDVNMPERAFGVCADLAHRYGPKLGMRTLDSLHVACALELGAERFWTFDERQAKLAKTLGLKVA